MDSTQSRPRAHSRTFSRSSEKSAGHLSAHEESAKARRDSLLRGESKANPNAAINEAQPGDVALAEKTTIESIRNIQHKDIHGNAITEPDLSNPTRPRWERPLDTIRSFERAIDGGYKRRSISRAESTYDSNNQFASRRSSYFGGNDSGPSPGRFSRAGSGYYGNGRPDSYYDGQGSSPVAPPRQRYGARAASDPHFGRYNGNGGYGGYAQHGHQQSHDTVNTGMTNGSDSTGPWNNSTDPSSENSSPDRATGRGKRNAQPMNEYGIDGVGGETIMEEYSSGQGGYPNRMQRGPNGYGAPAPPAHSAAPRKPIALGNSGGESNAFAAQTGTLPTNTRPQEEKKKGWLKRRFSKKE